MDNIQVVDNKLRNTGFICFLISGICSISTGIIVSLLKERYGLAYSMTGTLLSLLNIGNLLAGFAVAFLSEKIGTKYAAAILTAGYAIGYFVMSGVGLPFVLGMCFFLVGLAKGSTINLCTNLVGDNSEDKTKGMNLMHACYALGALICPFIITFTAGINAFAPTICLASGGVILWILFQSKLTNKEKHSSKNADWTFLRSKKFWILTGLLFCQNCAEQSVNGWLVTYFKDSGILSGSISAYTVTVMWSATLIGRLLIAFVFPIKKAGKMMAIMGIGCVIFYAFLLNASTPVIAIILLFCFAFAMAGLNPTAVASAGRMMSTQSMGIMLPTAALGAIIMPFLIGLVADASGIHAGMLLNLIPCAGMIVFAIMSKA